MPEIIEKTNVVFNTATFDDMTFIIFHPEEIQQSFWKYGMYYEADMVAFIQDNYKGGTFIDAGSCIGNHILAFSKLADKVYSFEPHIGVFAHQILNMIINKIQNVELFNLGLGDKTVVKSLYSDGRCAGGNTLLKESVVTKKFTEKKIQISTLDNFKIKDVKLIKIDVEGYEINVLKGAEKTIKKYKPDLFIECATEQMLKDVAGYLNPLKLGYTTFPVQFNNTPTFLFTTKEHNTYKVREKNDKNR